MIKKIFLSFIIAAIITVLPAATPFHKTSVATDLNNKVVVSESNSKINTVVSNVIKARFENMLNNNYIYDTDFESHRTIIENSILALLDKAENGEIDKSLVLGFIVDMYGLQVDAKAAEYDFAPANEGKFVILPRGYTDYEHKITSITEDGCGYTVVSEVVVFPHDGEQYTAIAQTEIVPNEGSSFGYNIVSSKLY